ncbi:hypothetical protein PFISCL1PPCAC_10303, partial [Pristionchus fissidentatus]
LIVLSSGISTLNSGSVGGTIPSPVVNSTGSDGFPSISPRGTTRIWNFVSGLKFSPSIINSTFPSVGSGSVYLTSFHSEVSSGGSSVVYEIMKSLMFFVGSSGSTGGENFSVTELLGCTFAVRSVIGSGASGRVLTTIGSDMGPSPRSE